VSEPVPNPIDGQSSGIHGQGVRFFSRENTAHIGRFAVPFPFSAILGILAIPVLFIAAAVSIPVSALHRSTERRRESRVAERLRQAGRTIRWADVLSEMNQNRGSLIEEYGSPKGPYRLWFTPENIVELSPHPCCFEELPWSEEDFGEFFKWCHARFTDIQSGSARLVEIPPLPDEGFAAALERSRRGRRCVSIGPSPLG
jgi:hypothetical protein